MRWEYRIYVISEDDLVIPEDIIDQQNNLEGIGDAGWEMISVIKHGRRDICYMKRKIDCTTCRLYVHRSVDKHGRDRFSGVCLDCNIRGMGPTRHWKPMKKEG